MGILRRPFPKFRVYRDGAPLANGNVYTYVPGTTNNKDTYSDSAGTVLNTNPISLDANGEADVWWNGTYDLKITDSTDANPVTYSDYGSGEGTVNYGNYNLVPDGGFEDDTNGDGLPDQWTVTEYPTAGSGAGVAILDTTSQIEGLNSLKFTSVGDGGGYAVSGFFNVREGAKLSLVWMMKSSVATVRNVVEVIWYTSAQVQISTSTVYDASSGNPTSWTEEFGNATAVTNARYAKLRVTGCHSSVATSGSTWFDDVKVGIPLYYSSNNFLLANNVALQSYDSAGTLIRDLIKTDSSDVTQVGTTIHDAKFNFLYYLGIGSAANNYICVFSGDIYLSYGAYYNGTNWIATQITASIFKVITTGGYACYYDSGLTIGNSFTPTNISSAFVTNANSPVISTTYLTWSTAFSASTWTSIGPTGSGAGYVWSALDSVPTGADWIECANKIDVGATATGNFSVYCMGRKHGSADSSTNSDRWLHAVSRYGVASGTDIDTTRFKIQLDSNNLFDLYYLVSNITTDASRLYLVGYGYN